VVDNLHWVTHTDAGNSLALAEIYLLVATLVMKFDFELYQTDKSDVEFDRDFTLPHVRPGSQLVRVLVKEAKLE
jgi:hypothetical protein